MVQRIEPIQVVTVTKDGECKVNISLELTINLNSDYLSIQATAKPQEPKTEKVNYEIPDFTSGITVDLGN